MSKIRKAAKGQDCTINLYPWCNDNPETTVLCHAPSDDKGMGLKSPDHWGAFGCSTCHDIADGRMKVDLGSEEIYRCHIRGVFRTQKILIGMGLIKV
jgi:hypothetical protein